MRVCAMLCDRLRSSTFSFCDDPVVYKVGMGCLPGDAAAVQLFVETYTLAVEPGLHVEGDELLRRITGICRLTGKSTQIKHTGFVDDLADKFAARSRYEMQVHGRVQNERLDEALRGIGTVQNVSKQVNLVYAVGKGSWMLPVEASEVLQGTIQGVFHDF